MAIKLAFKGLCLAGAVAVLAASAIAQTCTETEFGSKAGQEYLKAENELLVNKDAQAALAALNRLRALELNCYEEGAALRLGAAIKVETRDYAGAVRDFETALARGYIPASERTTIYLNIGQLYLQASNNPKALEYMNKWVQAGGKPDRDKAWQMAVLNQQVDNFSEALKWAEEVFRMDGPNAKKEVYDFLIFLYDKTGNLAKKAQLLEVLLQREPTNRKYWDAIAGDYFRGNQERKAFEVQKAMYLGGLLKTEDELMRIVNFYNRFNAPYHAARVLEKEMNAGRISKSYKNLELLVNLYQVAREFEKAIPVIEQAAQMTNSGEMYERLGRSYAELKQWKKTEDAMIKAINAGNLKDPGTAWVLVGQARFEQGERASAREAFRQANSRGGRGWLDFMAAEERTERALECFDIQSPLLELENEKKLCKSLAVVGEGNMPQGCATVDERLIAAQTKWQESGCADGS